MRHPVTHVVYAHDKQPALFLGRGYTGHEHLPQFGLINMNARLYDPALGRFLSPDPYVQIPDFSQNFNRYSYALNNPLKYRDESGEFFLFTFLNAAKDLFVNSFIKVWSQGFNAWSKSSNWHSTTMAFKIDIGQFKGSAKQILSRFFWERPQLTLGHLIGSVQNTFYGVKSVSYYGGATAIEAYSAGWGAFTLGSFIYGSRGIKASPSNSLFQHEYGHYLQSQASGFLYLQRYGIPSLVDAASDTDHSYHKVEQDANARALMYFAKNEPNYLTNGKPLGWNFSINPIREYDERRSFSENQGALNSALLSLSWIDYLFSHTNIIVPGMINSIILKQ